MLLLFEVGIEVDIERLRREHGALLWVAPPQTLLSTVIARRAFLVAGLDPVAARLLGLCVALSSSIVIVNITRSRRRTTDRPTEIALLGWSVLQDLVGVAIAADPARVRSGRATGRCSTRSSGWPGSGSWRARGRAAAAAGPAPPAGEHDLFLMTSVATGLTLAGLGAVVFGVPLALAAFVGGLAITESHEAAEARRRLLPFRDLFAVLVLRRHRDLGRPRGAAEGSPGWR